MPNTCWRPCRGRSGWRGTKQPSATIPAKALELVKAQKFDLILSTMCESPGKDGLTLLSEELKALGVTAPVVMMRPDRQTLKWLCEQHGWGRWTFWRNPSPL